MGRRRKIEIVQNLNNDPPKEVIKKKRGRKPKNKTLDTPPPEKVLKKRGRRPKEKYNFDTDPLKLQNYNDENDSIIVKLPIKKSDMESLITNKLTSYNPNVKTPEPYDPTIDDTKFNFSEIKKNIDNLKEDTSKKPIENMNDENIDTLIKINETLSEEKKTRQIDLILNNKYQKEQKLELITQFSNFTNENVYPERTDIACFWCSHNFDTIPWGIPISYDNDKFKLFGVFCSPNCACSYLFESAQFKDTLWEVYSLLNLFYYKVFNKIKKIYPAPSKLCLQKFGGKMTYEEFKKKNEDSESIYLIKFPPIISVIPVIEEVNLKKIQTNHNFIPVDKNRIMKANQELRLKRSKPINNKNTLDNCMNIISS